MYLLSQLMLLSKPTNLHPQISTATFGVFTVVTPGPALIAYQSINKGCAVCILQNQFCTGQIQVRVNELTHTWAV